MTLPLDLLDRRLLDGWQRDLPLTRRPFRSIGDALGVTEADVLVRLERLLVSGAIGRIGGICRPNTLAASTLASIAVPEERIDSVAAAVSAEPGVNHCYLREDAWNLWFVATAPDRAGVTAALDRIGRQTGLDVLDLPLVTAYHIDLGFSLEGVERPKPIAPPARPDMLMLEDRALIAQLCAGLPPVARPFAAVAGALHRPEADVLWRMRTLLAAGILTRVGLIVRHRPLGWRANAMAVWRVDEDRIDGVGGRLGAEPDVTLCYRRRPDRKYWPFNLYCMVHGRSRQETLAALDRAAKAAGLARLARRVLFSTRCFRQQGATVDLRQGEPA